MSPPFTKMTLGWARRSVLRAGMRKTEVGDEFAENQRRYRVTMTTPLRLPTAYDRQMLGADILQGDVIELFEYEEIDLLHCALCGAEYAEQRDLDWHIFEHEGGFDPA